MIRGEQEHCRWAKAFRGEPASQSVKELARLHRLAAELANALALQNMKIGVGIALYRALQETSSSQFPPFPKFDQDIQKLSDILNRAREIAGRQKGVPGRDNMLRNLVNRLQLFLFLNTGVGLARASETSKGRGGRATACFVFVSEVSKRVFGQEISRFTIDDAIKDTIRAHPIREKRAVGTLPARAKKKSPHQSTGE